MSELTDRQLGYLRRLRDQGPEPAGAPNGPKRQTYKRLEIVGVADIDQDVVSINDAGRAMLDRNDNPGPAAA